MGGKEFSVQISAAVTFLAGKHYKELAFTFILSSSLHLLGRKVSLLLGPNTTFHYKEKCPCY